MKVAIPRMGERVAPCLEHCATMAIFTLEGATIVDQFDIALRSRDPFDRVRLLREQLVDIIICGGIQTVYEEALRATGIRVVSWVSGSVDDLLALFVSGQLTPGTEVGELHAAHPATGRSHRS